MNVEQLLQNLGEFGVEYGIRVLGALAILVVGWIVAAWAGSAIRKWSSRSEHVDSTLGAFLSRLARVAIIIFTMLAVLAKFGVETTSIVGVLAAASLAVGMAMQGTLSNFAAGIMLLVFRPFSVDDFVNVAGESGTVVELGIFATELKPLSGEFTLIPNSKIWGETITNFSRNSVRRIALPIGIAYDDDHEQARTLLLEIAKNHPMVLNDPAAPAVVMSELGDSAVVMKLLCWVKTPDFVPATGELRELTKERFDAEGLNFPFPQRDVHMFNESA